jgi:hypothetical protein
MLDQDLRYDFVARMPYNDMILLLYIQPPPVAIDACLLLYIHLQILYIRLQTL